MCVSWLWLFCKIWTAYNFFWLHISLQDWIRQHQLVIGHRLNQELLPILCNILFFIFLLTFLTHWEPQCAVDRLWKKLVYIFLQIIDINDRFNVRSTISYYNVKHIKDNIYEVEAKGNYFRLVTLKLVHPINREFCSYDNAGTFDKQYVLAGYHSFVKLGQCIIVF